MLKIHVLKMTRTNSSHYEKICENATLVKNSYLPDGFKQRMPMKSDKTMLHWIKATEYRQGDCAPFPRETLKMSEHE